MTMRQSSQYGGQEHHDRRMANASVVHDETEFFPFASHTSPQSAELMWVGPSASDGTTGGRNTTGISSTVLPALQATAYAALPIACCCSVSSSIVPLESADSSASCQV
jgi:hypothetical protein